MAIIREADHDVIAIALSADDERAVRLLVEAGAVARLSLLLREYRRDKRNAELSLTTRINFQGGEAKRAHVAGWEEEKLLTSPPA